MAVHSVLAFPSKSRTPRILAATFVAVVAVIGTGWWSAATATAKSAQSPQAVSQCTQWDVSGTWQVVDGYYHSTVVFEQTDTALNGTMTLPNGQWQAADWTSQTNSLTGQVTGDQIDFLVTAPHRSGFLSKGSFRGTVTGDSSASGTAKDLAAPSRPAVAWSGTGQTRCVAFATASPAAVAPTAGSTTSTTGAPHTSSSNNTPVIIGAAAAAAVAAISAGVAVHRARTRDIAFHGFDQYIRAPGEDPPPK